MLFTQTHRLRRDLMLSDDGLVILRPLLSSSISDLNRRALAVPDLGSRT